VEKAQPGKTDAVLLQGKCLVNLAQFEEAGNLLSAYLAQHPTSDDAGYTLAYVRFRQNRPRESLDLMYTAAKLKPPSADDLKVGALDYVLLNDYSDAARYLEEAVRISPDNVEARYHLGRVRYQQNRFDDAIAAFREVLRLDPRYTKAADNLGLSLEAMNRMEEAQTAYKKAIELDHASFTHTEQPYLNLGALLVKTDRAADAVPILQQAAEIAPKSNAVQYQLSKAYFDLRQWPDAQRTAEEAVRLDSKDASAHYLLGRIYQRSNHPEQAAHEFKLTEELRQSQQAGGGMASGSKRQ
jgi:tetratricopeptide (TPR) repeat protein